MTENRDERMLRELNEKFHGDVGDWVAAKNRENESFWGKDLIEEKRQRLMRLKAICMELAERNRDIENTFMPFDNSHRHGSAQIKIPHFCFCQDKATIDAISELYKLSDMTVSFVGNRAVLLTFTVADMWENWTVNEE